jgi:creatinine amidohydrolase
MCDITKSVAYHGFKKILIVDGHGSNLPLVDIVARRTIMETDTLCASVIYTNLIVDIAKEIRESPIPGGMAHACELETSMYWHVDPERVQTDKFQKEMAVPLAIHLARPDQPVPGSDDGVVEHVFAHRRTWRPHARQSGERARLYEVLIDRMVALVQELRSRPIRPRADLHQDQPVTPIGG